MLHRGHKTAKMKGNVWGVITAQYDSLKVDGRYTRPVTFEFMLYSHLFLLDIQAYRRTIAELNTCNLSTLFHQVLFYEI